MRSAASLRSPRVDARCPGCGAEAVATRSGQCVHCLEPLPGRASAIGPARILQLGDLERSRRALGGGRRGRRMRAAGAVGGGLLGGAVVVVLFGLCLRWLLGFFSRGVIRVE